MFALSTQVLSVHLDLDPQRLGRDRIHFWRACVGDWDPAGASSRALLDGEEQTAAERFVHAADRNRYEASHIALRQILARYVEQPPDELRFRRTAAGKPELQGPSEIRFSLAHCGDWAVVAVSMSPVGVDVEQPRRRALPPALIERVCASGEQRAFALLREDDRRALLLDCWTGKEAILKAVGCGLRGDPSGIDVLEHRAGNDATAVVAPAISKQAWRVRWFDVGQQYVAAAATSIAMPRYEIASWSFG